jgi:hypothetical protein
VQNINPRREPDSVNRAVRVAAVILNQFQHTRTAETSQNLGVRWCLPELNRVECHAERIVGTLSGPFELDRPKPPASGGVDPLSIYIYFHMARQ